MPIRAQMRMSRPRPGGAAAGIWCGLHGRNLGREALAVNAKVVPVSYDRETSPALVPMSGTARPNNARAVRISHGTRGIKRGG